ncbi:MAG: hypothetical protein KF718_25365 [Polyangiaceae bacterium]|nr:hypothetical protein [Polyangiaceae bacterium]
MRALGLALASLALSGCPFLVSDDYEIGDPADAGADAAPAACSDGVLNGQETATDCGGGACEGCPNGSACVLARDCLSNLCTGQLCTP